MAKLPPPPSSGKQGTPSPSPEDGPRRPAITIKKPLAAPAANADAPAAGSPQPGVRPPPPPPSAPQAPREPRPPMSQKSKIMLGGAAAALALIVAAVMWIQHLGSRPSGSIVLDYLNQNVAGGMVHFTSAECAVVAKNGKQVELTVKATGAVKESRFVQTDAAAFGKDLIAADAIDNAAAILKRREGGRLRELAKLGPPPADFRRATLLKETVAAGKELAYQGRVSALKQGSDWAFHGLSGSFDMSGPIGDAREKFASDAIVVSDPAGAEKIKALVVANRDYAQQVLTAAEKFAPTIAEERAKAAEAIIGQLKSGSLFSGTFQSPRDGTNGIVYLEITTFNERNGTLTALMRNDSGGADGRVFQGQWRYDEPSETVQVKLGTRSNQASNEAGPILNMYDDWVIQMTLDSAGRLQGQAGSWTYDLAYVATSNLPQVRSVMLEGINALLEKTRPGRVYLGTITSRRNGESDRVMLIWEKQEPKTGAVSGKIQSVSRSAQMRRFTGLLIGNKYRAQNKPLRLELAPGSGGNGLLANTYNTNVNFQVEGDELRAEVDPYEIALNIASDAELTEIKNQQKAAVDSFYRVVRTGATYDGTGRDRRGYVGRIRLRIQSVNEAERTVMFSIDSREQSGLGHQFTGAFFVEDRQIVSNSTGVGKYNPSGIRKIPFLSQEGQFRMRLTVGPEGITGELENHQDWSFEFPLQPNAMPTAVDTPNDNPPELQGYPPIPTRNGGYLLDGSNWVALPQNGGKAVSSLLSVVGSIGDLLGGLKNPARNTAPEGAKLAVLRFDGREKAPVVSGERVMILFIGDLQGPTPDQLREYPQLAEYPQMEVAPVRTNADGTREVDLLRIVPGLAGFGEQRVSGTVDKITPKMFLFTATSPLPSGNYAVSAGSNPFEFTVR